MIGWDFSHTPKLPTLVIAISLICLCTGSASAAIVVSGESLRLLSPESTVTVPVEFALDLTGSDDGSSLSLGNFQLDILLVGPSAGSDVSILDAGTTVGRQQVRNLDVVTTTTTTAFGGTLNFLAPFDVADNSGLFRIDLEIRQGTIGDYTLQVLAGPDQTLLTDPDDFFTPIPFTPVNANLSITAIPEPSCLGIGLAASALLTIRRRHRKKQMTDQFAPLTD